MSPKIPKPRLRDISPLVHSSSWSFVFLNAFFLAPAFFLGASNKLVLVGLIPSKIWGILFIIHSIALGVALIRNQWKLIKFLLFVGLTMKAGFGWALLFTLLISWLNIGVIGVWLGLMTWQALCIVYFTPKVNYGSSE